MQRPTPGRLFVIPNTLGGVAPAEVLAGRTLEVARRLSHFVAETPKLARAFLKSIDSQHALQSITISELSEHTRPEDVARLLQPALDGHDLGLVSDAGCPGIADPGALLVAAAHDAGVIVVPLPGPSAILLALMASGMDGQRFVFHGYLPAKTDARAAAIRALDAATARDGATQIFIETPYRNDAMLVGAARARERPVAAVRRRRSHRPDGARAQRARRAMAPARAAGSGAAAGGVPAGARRFGYSSTPLLM